MIIALSTRVDSAARRTVHKMRQWSLWSLRRSAVAVIIAVDLSAVTFEALAWLWVTPSVAAWSRWVLLVVLATGYGEATSRIELLRRYLAVDRGPMSTVIGAWALPAALVLPPGLAGLLNVVIVAHMTAWTFRTASTRTHRVLFGGATGVLATLGAATVSTATGLRSVFWSLRWPVWAPLVVLAAMVAYTTVNAGLIIAGMYAATRPTHLRMLLLSGDDLVLEYATLTVGVLTAVILTGTLWLTPAVTVVLVLLQRSTLAAKLRTVATQDSKTGLLNAATWEQRAGSELRRAERDRAPAALLLIDLDHFKHVNDTHGHLVGDAVLRAVAAVLAAELRGHDVIGRFGGEEFAVLLPGAGPADAWLIADRVRTRISDETTPVSVTASIGVAHYRNHGVTVFDLLRAADDALYAAKRAGRNRVTVAITASV